MATQDPIDLTALANAQDEERLALERKVLQDAEDLKWLMAHKQGRRLVDKWLERSGIYRNPFNHSGSVTAFNCGQMNLGQQMLAEIMTHAPDAYLKLLDERKRNDN